MRYAQRQLDPNTEGGGGTTNPTEGGATETPEQKEQKAEIAELQTLLGKDNYNDTEKARLEALQGKYDATPKDAKGNPLTPEQVKQIKETQTKVNVILAKEEKDRTPEEIKFIEEHTEEEKPDAKSIYEQVDELKGEKVEVEYGDVDPTSPQGILLREEAIADRAMATAEAEIKAKYPRAYALMLHLSQGGKEEDFYKPQNQDFSKVALSESDKASQENILRTALSLKGNSPAIIDAVITSIKDKGTLFETAKAELEALQQDQKRRETDLANKTREARAKEMQDMGKFASDMQAAVEKGFDGVVVPAKDRKDFIKFVGERIHYNNGEFMTVAKLDTKELNKALKVAYFEFKGGDLTGLAERTAKTLQARKLKQSINLEIVPKGTGTQQKPRFTPLASL